MKFTIASLAIALASFAHLAVADDCTPGLNYCGYNLLAKGDYYQQMKQELYTWQDEPVTEDLMNSGLFLCTKRNNGDVTIMWMRQCPESQVCTDGGPGVSDRCA